MNPELTSLKLRIQSLLSAPDYRPMRVSEVIQALKIPTHDRGKVRRALERLVQEGIIVRVRKDRLVLPSEADLVTGRLQMHERGFGFLVPESTTPQKSRQSDIFISAEDTAVAMHGDRVVVRTHATPVEGRGRRRTPPTKQFGRVIRVLERANPTLVGVLQKTSQFHYVVPDDPRIGRDIYIALEKGSPKVRVGERVVVKLLPWENRHINPEGTLVEVIGPSDDPSLDLLVIVKKFRFRVDFPEEALEEAQKIEEVVAASERKRRTDFTGEIVVTIDPDDARDHDDALSLKPLAQGRWQLGVHIADVSHYVQPGSALDREARERGNSVYLPDRVIPMLPEKLSNGICSLKEGVERLTQTVLFEISADGVVESYTFCDSIIRSSARLTYKQALAVIKPSTQDATTKRRPPEGDQSEGNASPPLPPPTDPEICQLLRNLASLAMRLRHHRFVNGSLDLDFPELKVYCDAKGFAIRIEKTANDISHQLVEEFMLLANEAVAAEIRQRGVPSIYRIHDDPDPERLEEYRELVIANGYQMGDPTARGEIQKLLKRLVGKPEEYILKLSLLRSLKRAQYSTSPVGHFGLAKENYTHFTSPIRRYADLVIHRTLAQATRTSRKPSATTRASYDVATLETIALHCSGTERVADEAEKEAVRLKLIEYFEKQLITHKLQTFDALITEVRNFGLFVELPDYMLSGLVHISTIADDFYNYDAPRQKLVGRRTQRTFQAGTKVRVEVARVDRFKRQIDFKLCEE